MSDVPGHVKGTSQNGGLVNGKGTITVTRVNTYQDGSTLSIKALGNATPVDGGRKVVYEGTYEWSGGTGRFEGMMGKGTYKGERLGSPKTGSDTYIDFSGTEWKKWSVNEQPVNEAVGTGAIPAPQEPFFGRLQSRLKRRGETTGKKYLQGSNTRPFPFRRL